MFKTGARIGSFDVVAPLGAGGMGQVWRAKDTKLQREVAIKVLPEDFASDAERVSRFHREAQALAALNHPNIAAIHDFQDIGQSKFIVLELVEGITLAERIASGAIPLQESLRLAGQIAEALEAAHEKGIIHRDLKPANIKITPEGKVKVLDFGLAKVFDAGEFTDISKSPTVVSRSVPGVIMGTPAYLSPEQARGKPVDKRTDIWAFGCVLFEMLTGRQTFGGETMSDVMASILARDVTWNELPNDLPPRVRELISRCLQKDAMRRLRDIGDARIQIEDALAETAAPITTQPTRALKRFAVVTLSLASAVIALLIGVIWLATKGPATNQGWSGAMLGGPSVAFGPRLSPDGRLLAFQAMVDDLTQVAVMQPESGDWTVLTRDRTRGYVADVSWSHDGTRIYYGRLDGTPKGGRLQPYPAYPSAYVDHSRVRVAPEGTEAVFFGRSQDQPAADRKDYLYTLNLGSSEVQRLPSELQLRTADLLLSEWSSFTVNRDGTSIVGTQPSGDLLSLIEVTRLGGPARHLISLTSGSFALDVSQDGSIYADQTTRPLELIRYSTSEGAGETILTSGIGNSGPAVLTDGRIVIGTRSGGRGRLIVTKEGSDPTTFVQTNEETSAPVTVIGKNEVAFIIGSANMRSIAIASANDGRISRRLSKIDGGTVTAMAGSSDGKTLYYASAGKVWSVASNDGEPRFIREGDSIATDPNGRYLIIQLNEKDAVRLVRVPLDGKPEQPLNYPGARLAGIPITANAVRADGTIVKAIASSDSWFWSAGLLNPQTGEVKRIKLAPGLDVHFPGWAPDGTLIAATFRINSALWRFKPNP